MRTRPYARTLLVLVARDRGLREALEPRVVVLVEAPALALELVRGQVLRVAVRLEVERKEQALGVHLRVIHGVIKIKKCHMCQSLVEEQDWCGCTCTKMR